jgi:hypothetical protein
MESRLKPTIIRFPRPLLEVVSIMRIPATFLFLSAIFLSGFLSAAETVSPFKVGDRSQLFVDKVLVRDTENISFNLVPARKHPENPVVRADRPWEGWRLEIYGNAIYDEEDKVFKMWYLGEETETFPHYALYYATSADGVHWEKPLVGTVKAEKYPEHNAVAEQVLLASVMKDNDDPDPQKRYKMICWLQKDHAYHTMISPDGLNWTKFSEQPIAPSGDVITGYYDERRKKYVAFPKIGHPVRGHDRRVFWQITSEDFVDWSEPKLAFTPDLRDDASSLARIEEVRPILDVPDDPEVMRTEFYGIGAYPAESCTLAFVWMFTINNNARYGNQEGPGELQLAVSRDLENWERPFRTPCVPRGEIGEWDCGFFCTQSRALKVDDEVWLYYGGSNYTHGTPCLYRKEGTGRLSEFTGSIGLAIWDSDRFVSVEAPAEDGTLTTVPLVFEGDRLEINAKTSENGEITVEILDSAGTPIPAFERSAPIKGDDLRHEAAFSGGGRIGDLEGKPIVLKFHLKDAELFAFAFRRPEP